MTYAPPSNYSGPASFAYTASDGVATSAPATVTIIVTPVNDPPTANPDIANGDEDQLASTNVLVNDSDIDSTTLVLTSVSGMGPVPTFSVDGSVSVMPAANFHGPLNYTYSVSDGALSTTGMLRFDIAPVNDMPAGGYAGPDTMTFTANDGALSATGTVSIDVTAPIMVDAGVPDAAIDDATTDASQLRPDADHPSGVDDGDAGGCGCASSGRSPASALPFLVALTIVLRRRRDPSCQAREVGAVRRRH